MPKVESWLKAVRVVRLRKVQFFESVGRYNREQRQELSIRVEKTNTITGEA